MIASELQDQILQKLYEHRDQAEYVNITEAFGTVTFQLLYENVGHLHQSKLVDFYTAPEAYAVFNEPDFIRAKIRPEGIQYYREHYPFYKKNKNLVRIGVGVVALLVVVYLIKIAIGNNHSDLSENNPAEQPLSTVPDDSIATQTKDTLTLPPPTESRQPIKQDTTNFRRHQAKEQLKSDTLIAEQKVDDTAAGTDHPVKSGDQNGEVKNQYTMELDTLNHLIKVSLIAGKWDSTVLAIPINEIELVQPQFHSADEARLSGREFVFIALGQRFSGIIAMGPSSSNDLNYTFHYVNKPTLFLFGGYPNTVHPYYFRQEAK